MNTARTTFTPTTVSFHNSKSQNFKLSVSNPKGKYVAYLSVLSQISNCQSLGRKNKHEILKTDRQQVEITPQVRDFILGVLLTETCVYIYIYIYIYTCMCIYIYMYISVYIYIYRDI